MATAAFAIRDAKVPGENIHILEELDVTGGNMDGAKSPAVPGTYVTRGGRMFDGFLGCCDQVCARPLRERSGRNQATRPMAGR